MSPGTSSRFDPSSGKDTTNSPVGSYAVCASYLAPLSCDLLRALWQDRPDVLFTQDYASGKFDVLLAIAAALDVPLVARHAGSRPEGYVGKVARRWTIRRANVMIASNAAERALLVDRFGVPPERVTVILTPIETSAFRPIAREEACAAAGLDAGRRYLLCVGRLSDHEKRLGALVGRRVNISDDGATVTVDEANAPPLVRPMRIALRVPAGVPSVITVRRGGAEHHLEPARASSGHSVIEIPAG